MEAEGSRRVICRPRQGDPVRVGYLLLLLTLSGASQCLRAADEPTSNLLACATLRNDSERLACYDRLAADKQAALLTGQQERRDSVAPPNPDSPPAAESHHNSATRHEMSALHPNDSAAGYQLGDELVHKSLRQESRQLPRQLQAGVATISHLPRGELVLRLDNGQVWEQSDDAPDLKLKVGDEVTIARGLLGSYWLSANSRLAMKVRRTR